MNKVEWLQKYIDEIKCRSNGKDIYIYGAGMAGGIIKTLCDDEHIKVNGFVVTNKDVAVNNKDGLPVMQFDQMREIWKKMFILVGVKEWGDHTIEKYLHSFGFEDFIPTPLGILDLDMLHNAKKSRPSIGVTPVIGCSVNCRYCPQELLLSKYFEKDKKRKSHMTYDDFKVYIGHMPQETIVEFSGFVEPFLNKEAINMMEYTAEIGRDMTLYTTLVGVDDDILERVIKLPFKKVVLHTADADGYAHISVTENYLQLLERVINAQKADGSPFVDASNCQSTPDKAVLQITSGKVNNHYELHDRAGNLEECKEQRIKHFEKHGSIYCSMGEELDNFVLLPDGTVVLCCMDFGMQHVMGNLYTDTYEDIMWGEAMKSLKRAMKVENPSTPCICRKCRYAIEK